MRMKMICKKVSYRRSKMANIRAEVDETKLVQLFNNGMAYDDMAHELNISNGLVARRLHELGLCRRTKSKSVYTDELVAKIKKLMDQTRYIKEIATELDIHENSLYVFIRKEGLKTEDYKKRVAARRKKEGKSAQKNTNRKVNHISRNLSSKHKVHKHCETCRYRPGSSCHYGIMTGRPRNRYDVATNEIIVIHPKDCKYYKDTYKLPNVNQLKISASPIEII
jgi:Zn-dependent peptidase ImmA (M78 family)